MAYSKKGKGSSSQAPQYYVWYLGWKECRGLGGREYTEPIVKDLVFRRKNEDLPKLTIEVNQKELKIFQLNKTKWGKTDKVKFPSVPVKDVTYAVQGLPPDEDIVACIYLGFNPTTRQAVHVHVYRCDSPQTAYHFADHLMDIVKMPEHTDRIHSIEQQLASRGEIVPRPRNFINTFEGMSTVTGTSVDTATIRNYSDDDSDSGNPRSPNGTDGRYREELDPYGRERDEKMDSLASELRRKLGNRNQPILLPPQDYDTVRRKQGDLKQYDSRKCTNIDIIGGALFEADDSARGDSDSNSGKLDRYGSTHSDGLSSRNSDHADSQEREYPGVFPSEGDYRRQSSDADRDKRLSNGHNIPEERISIEADLHPIAPRWKQGPSQKYNPPSGPYVRPRSPSPRSPRRARSPSPPGQMVGRNASPGYRGRSPPRRARSPSPSGPRGYPRDAGNRARSPHPVFNGDGRARSPRRLPRSGSQTRYVYDEVPYNNMPVPEMQPVRSPREGPYDGGPKKYTPAALGLGNAAYHNGPPPGQRPHDEGYKSLERPDVYAQSYQDSGRKKDKKDKKKDKKGKRNRSVDNNIRVDHIVVQNPAGPGAGPGRRPMYST